MPEKPVQVWNEPRVKWDRSRARLKRKCMVGNESKVVTWGRDRREGRGRVVRKQKLPTCLTHVA